MATSERKGTGKGGLPLLGKGPNDADEPPRFPLIWPIETCEKRNNKMDRDLIFILTNIRRIMEFCHFFRKQVDLDLQKLTVR